MIRSFWKSWLAKIFGKKTSNQPRISKGNIPSLSPLEDRITPALSQIADINTLPFGITPEFLTQVGSIVFFTADSRTEGRELWKTNGTASGTVLIKDILPGSDASYPGDLVNVNGTLFFTADDGKNGRELWKSDGTASGTVLVKDINPGSEGSNPFNLVNVNGTLFFAANDGKNGTELWKSNGTAGGTVLVKDIDPRSQYGFPSSSNPTSLTSAKGTLFFLASDPDSGRELWKSDGTASGTVLVKDLQPGRYNSYLSSLTASKGGVFFTTYSSEVGSELWRSDGTEAGTIIVKDIASGTYDWGSPKSSNPLDLTDVNGTLFFSASDGVNGRELWKSDGSEAGTVLVKNIASQEKNGDPSFLANINGRLAFTANDGKNGLAVWQSDGTEGGTKLVKAIPEAVKFLSIEFKESKGNVYSIVKGETGNYLWKSDGTEAGTTQLKSFDFEGIYGGSPGGLTDFNGSLLFAGLDSTNGQQLWTSDGTTQGTKPLTTTKIGTKDSYPYNYTNVNGVVYFTAEDGKNGRELWKTDGTASGTILVKDILAGVSGSNPDDLTSVNGTLFFTVNDGKTGVELWKSDGTAGGTVLVKDIFPGSSYGAPNSSNPRNLTNVQGTLFFTADDGKTGRDLWKSDGTTSGTVKVQDIGTNSTYSISNLTAFKNTLFFASNDGKSGTELWKSDGTTAGTVLVSDILSGESGSYPSALTVVDGTLFFTAGNGKAGRELWKTDGASTGTVLVKDIRSGEIGSYPNSLINVNGSLFFTANDGTNGVELWKSDGTSSGTVMVWDSVTGSAGAYPNSMTSVKGKLFFTTIDSEKNQETLWTHDSAASTTKALKTFDRPGGFYGGGAFSDLTDFNGSLLFAANDGVNGKELWKSDGTESGTLIAGEFVPGKQGGNPYGLTPVGGKVFLSASNQNGNEPWIYTETSSPVITSSPSATFVYGQTVNFSIQASGFPAPTFALSSGSLPAGISLDSKTGVLSGKASAGEYKFTVRATNNINPVATQAFTLTVNKANLTITPNPIRKVQGTVYNFTGKEFTLSPLANSADKVDSVKLTSLGTPASAKVGQFEILASQPTGVGLSNYNITFEKGVLTVGAPNQAPSGADKTLTINEDQNYSLSASDFGFTDPIDRDQLLSVKITALPTKGSLKLNGVALTSKNNTRDVLATELGSGALVYTPGLNENGSKYGFFTFQVRDNGGTQGGGKDLDPTPNTLLFNVNPVNDPPVGAAKTVTFNEGATYKFGLADFPFTDLEKNALSMVRITELPAEGKGSLKLNGKAMQLNQEVTATDLSKGLLTFTPVQDGQGTGFASLKFQIRDSGGTANGGVDLDPTPRVLTMNVNNINDAPIGSNKTVTINEDIVYKFVSTDFPFTDLENNALSSVKITSLPLAAKGTLKLNGVALTVNKEVTVTDISKGLFTFTPAKDANGLNFATFNFQVRDNGGTANGGINLDPTARALTINVTPVNDAPTLTTVSTLTGAKRNSPFEITYEMLAGAANERDVDGDPLSFRIQTVSAGQLEKFDGTKWVTVVAGQTLLSSSQKIRWTSSAIGSALNAFTIVAWDGKLPSAPSVQVKISVTT